mmetsp:Transcript_41758/g.96607  ORF Transcript_41758/g.96607 Transcript_41758/m.96607 type:complete len:205 (+) Transcript_41758:789-1403(+)
MVRALGLVFQPRRVEERRSDGIPLLGALFAVEKHVLVGGVDLIVHLGVETVAIDGGIIFRCYRREIAGDWAFEDLSVIFVVGAASRANTSRAFARVVLGVFRFLPLHPRGARRKTNSLGELFAMVTLPRRVVGEGTALGPLVFLLLVELEPRQAHLGRPLVISLFASRDHLIQVVRGHLAVEEPVAVATKVRVDRLFPLEAETV